jgi:hypothetical protein
MKKFFYLVATPESVIVSHLDPFRFGNYLAVGAKKQLHGQAVFFEIDPDKTRLHQDYVNMKMKPYDSGEPKRSVYLSIYRCFEQIPLKALRNLYLATDDGKVLEIEAHDYFAKTSDDIHLYQQLVPITTQVASNLSPVDYIMHLTNLKNPVSAPKVFMVDLQLGELSKSPDAPVGNLPYHNPAHLKDCIKKLKESPGRKTKTVLRFLRDELPYRIVKTGFFIGDQDHYLFYPFPSIKDLEGKYYSWWRSALVMHF